MINTSHNMFLSRKMGADYNGAYLESVSISTDQDMGALITLGTAVSSPVFSSNLDMDNRVGNYPNAIATENIYVLDDPSVYNYNDLRIDIVDPRAVYIPANYVARAKKLNTGDTAWWSTGCFATTAVTPGTSYVIPTQNSGQWTVSATLPSTSTSKVIGKVIAARNTSVGNSIVAGYDVSIINS